MTRKRQAKVIDLLGMSPEAYVDYSNERKLNHRISLYSNSKCPSCGDLIRKGQVINLYAVRENRRKWKHVDCPTEKDRLNGVQPKRFEPVPAEPSVPQPNIDLQPILERLDNLDEINNLLVNENQNLHHKIKALQDQQPKQVNVHFPDRCTISKPDDLGELHPAFDDVAQLLAQSIPVLLIGPAGSGKSYLCEQLGKAFRVPSYVTSCSAGMSEQELIGRIMPGTWQYCDVPFTQAFKDGGVHCLDEVDAADPNVLLKLNAAIANGRLPTPHNVNCTEITAHEHFYNVCCANTFGRGANRLYVGRNQLDEAFLDRFRVGTIELDYDSSLERKLADCDELVDRVQSIREQVEQASLRRVVSMRFTLQGAKMVKAGWSVEKVVSRLLAGWSEAELRKVA